MAMGSWPARPAKRGVSTRFSALSALSAASFLGVLGLLSCAPLVMPAPPRPPAEPALPPVPAVDGPLQISVVHPPEDELLPAVDSTFIFGAVGSGRATLTIDGVSVAVAPNGAFLAFLPLPPDSVYTLVAQRGEEQATFERRIRIAPAPVRTVIGTQIVPGSVYPRGSWTALEGEPIEVGFRGTPGGRAALVLPTGERYPLPERRVPPEPPPGAAFIAMPVTPSPRAELRVAEYAGTFPARALLSPDTALALPALAVPTASPADRAGARVELIAGGDTVSVPVPLNLATLPTPSPRVGVAAFAGPGQPTWDWTIRGRNHPTGPFHYFWPAGTRMTITGERDGMYRVRLADDLEAWAPAADLRLLPAGAPPPRSLVGSARFLAADAHIDLRVPLAERLPFHVQVEDAHTLDVFVYGATSTANFFQYGTLDPLMQSAEWRQPATGVFQVRVRLSQPVWGYLPFYDEAGALVVRIRRPPIVDPARPLAGLLIAVDPGHPPGGATGPTGLTEADANLAIALRLRPLLEAAGAQVLMTREDTSTVPLAERPRLSTEHNAHLFVSVHNNAFPDGVNPFLNHGTSVYYYFPHSVELAQAMQREILAELGLPDIGIGRADFAVVRQSWMPAVLTESTFMMFPEQEAALRDPRVQERLARAHLRALESFVRARMP
jgi:N-acetylmuramoyl-L-alanine amidase